MEIPKHQSHLDVAVIVAGVTTVARVNQNGVEAIHDGVAWALRHVWADVQEFWITHILKKEKEKKAFINHSVEICRVNKYITEITNWN